MMPRILFPSLRLVSTLTPSLSPLTAASNGMEGLLWSRRLIHCIRLLWPGTPLALHTIIPLYAFGRESASAINCMAKCNLLWLPPLATFPSFPHKNDLHNRYADTLGHPSEAPARGNSISPLPGLGS